MSQHSEYHDDVFDVLKEFKAEEKPVIDWSLIWDQDELFEGVLDGIDTLMNNISLLPDLDKAEKIPLLGKLAYNRAHFAFLYGDEDHIKEFIEAGMEVTTLVHQIVNIPGILDQGSQRFELYEEIETDLQEGELDNIPLSVMAELRPVFIAIAAMTIITIDQPEYQ